MRIETLTEENTAATTKSSTEEASNKLYKNYNSNNKNSIKLVSSSKNQCQNDQLQLQQQQKQLQNYRAFAKVRNNNKYFKHNNNNDAHHIDGNRIAGISKNPRKIGNESIYNQQSIINSNTSCNNRNNSSTLSLNDESILGIATTATNNPRHIYLPHALEQLQQLQYNSYNYNNYNQNNNSNSTHNHITFSSIFDANASKMIDSPVASAIYSASWRARNSNNINTTTLTPTNYNDDNNNNENKICCQASSLIAIPSVDKETLAAFISPENIRHCVIQQNQGFQQQQELHTNFLLSNAKIGIIKPLNNSPNSQRRDSSIAITTNLLNSSIEIAQTEALNSQQHQQQQQQQQQSSNSSNITISFPNLLKTQSTTARTKSPPNIITTASSSSSSTPFPLMINTGNKTNPGIQENGSKGGGGGKNNFNRKKFWKLNSHHHHNNNNNNNNNVGVGVLKNNIANSEGIGVLNSGNNNSELSTANDILSKTESNTSIKSVSPKPTNRGKNSNSKNDKYQPQPQTPYPQTWKKNSTSTNTPTPTAGAIAATSTSSDTNITSTDPRSTIEAQTVICTSTSPNMAANLKIINPTSTEIESPKTRSKLDDKAATDTLTTAAVTAATATTTTMTKKGTQLEDKTPATAFQQQLLPLRVSPRKNSSHAENENMGSVNRNFPAGAPSYSLDFLHSVGKRMLGIGTEFPTTTGIRNNSTTSPKNNQQSVQSQQQQSQQQSNHRSNRYSQHNNGGYGHNNQHHHHHHHHPQPQQLTIASFLQKDMFGSNSNNVRGVGNVNTSNNNNAGTPSSSINSENSPHAFSNQSQYQQHRMHNSYNHPHYYRHQNMYQAYNGQTGIVPSANNAHRYHSNGGNNGTAENQQRQQNNRNQQHRQQMEHQMQYGGGGNHGNNNFGTPTTNRKHKNQGQQSKNSNTQNTTSPTSSISSLSSLASAASAQAGGNSRQSNGSNKTNSRANSAGEMQQPPKGGNQYSVNSNAGNYRHNNHNRHHNGHHFNHHIAQNIPPVGAVMAQHQNFNNLTYVITNGNGALNNMPHLNSKPHALNNLSNSEPSSRACSPSILSSSDNANPEASSRAIQSGGHHRHGDRRAYTMNNQNMRSSNAGSASDSKNESLKTESGGNNDYDDSECSSSQQSEDGLRRCNSYHQLRPLSTLSQSSQAPNSQIPSPMDFAYNPLMQHIPPSIMHFQQNLYRNGMMPPNANLPPNCYHEDDYHINGAIQQQLPNMFYSANDQSNVGSGHNTNGYSNAGNVMFSQSAVTLIPPCPSNTSIMSRSSEDETQVLSSRSSSSGSDQLKGSTPDISSDGLNEMHDSMVGMNRVNVGTNTFPSARARNIRNHQHCHTMPPPFVHYPINQQSVFCSNYLAYLRSTPSNTSSDLSANTPPDRFMSRSHLVEVKEAPSTLLNNSKWDNLSQQIWSKFMDSQQTEETYKLKMRLWRYLYVTIKQTYPRYGLYLVGSTMSGFGADTSDVDMCLVSRSFAFVEQRMEALFNLTILQECLRKTEDFESFNLIEAKVPILRFRDKSNHFEVDLNFNNSVGIKNTHLLYCYTQLDWRLRPLALIVKLWAQYHDINNAKNMTISSYSLVLMVIHFLQCGVSPPVLPCLHKMFPEKFTPLRSNDFGHVDMNDYVGPYESNNTQTLGELFLNFLEYYSSFDYRQNAISVRTGGLLPVNVCRQAKSLKNDIHQWKELCIEEPFDLTNTARSVYDFDTFERVKAIFSASFRVMQKTLDLNSIFAPLVLPRLPISARIYMKRTPMANLPFGSKDLDSDDPPLKGDLNKIEEPIDYCSDDEKSSLRDDKKHIEEKIVGRGADIAPATAL